MAFKMTPGIKGKPAMDRIKNLSACGGPGQPPCEPLFEKEKQEMKIKRFKKATSRKAPVKETPVKETPPKEAPVKPGKPVLENPVKPVKPVKPIEGGEGEGEGGKKPGKGKK